MTDDELLREQMEALLNQLNTLRIKGPGRGGPHIGIGHNSLTRQIVSLGNPIIPLLIARLPGSNFNEAVYIVFILRELHAKHAHPAILELQSEVDKRSIGHDLTLKMQIEYFLRDMDKW